MYLTLTALLITQMLLAFGGHLQGCLRLHSLFVVIAMASAFVLPLDGLALTGYLLLCYTALLFNLIGHFAIHYFASDKNQKHWLTGISYLQFVVFLILTTHNAMTLVLANIGLSACLYYLIHQGQAKSLRLIPRTLFTGDALLALALGSLAWTSHSLELSTLSQQAMPIWVVVLFLCAVLMKSGCFPFQQWLVQSINAPVPISALMHAGVINLGAYLLLVFHNSLFTVPLVTYTFIAVVLIGSIVGQCLLIIQVDEKRKLVYSTSSQFSFMYLQSALGFVFGSLYHLMLHGMLKSNLFLSQSARVGRLVKPVPYSTQQDLFLILLSLGLSWLANFYSDASLLLLFFLSFSIVTAISDACANAQASGGALLLSIVTATLIPIFLAYAALQHWFSVWLKWPEPLLDVPVALFFITTYSLAYLFRYPIAHWLAVNLPLLKLRWHAWQNSCCQSKISLPRRDYS